MIKEKSLQDLDYFKVLEIIANFSNSEATANAIRQIYPSKSLKEAEERLTEFKEIKEYKERGGEIPLSSFPDISSLLQRASKEGVFFEAWELTNFLKVLRVLDRISSCLEKLLDFPSLTLKIRDLLGSHLTVGQPYLLQRLENTVDEEGNILDTASTMLKYLRKQIKLTEERIREKLEEFINRKEINIFLQDRFITKRKDRWVIPVRMDSKGQIKGKVQDVSRSGETAFVEPEEIAHLSQKLEELKVEEQLEEIRILRELSDNIHQVSSTLEREFQLLIYLDKLNALYTFAEKFNASVSYLNSSKHISFIEARHPLLMLSLRRVIPLNFELKDKNVLVITGPNAGGKTVTLKTIGLLTAMAISGLPVPANPSSTIPFVRSIYVDLYHEGSLEEQLSSFTSHVVTLKEIIEEANSESLILLDEIGTNTDPEEGSALASAIVEELRNRGALTFVTTHLSKLKLFALGQEGMEVAAMEFDEKTMTPLYRLSIGSLTTSYALEVAKKYGFPERLIKRAYELKGTEDRKLYDLMKELETAKEQYLSKMQDLEKTKEALFHEKERLQRELQKIEERKKKALQQAKEEAHSIIQKFKKEINTLYEEAKKAERQKLREISKKISEMERTLEPQEGRNLEKIKIGDFVKIRNLKLSGKVIAIDDGRAKVKTETAQIEVALDEIKRLEPIDSPKQILSVEKQLIKEDDTDSISKKLDIRGMKVEEALPLVERYLNELSLKEATKGLIIHGIGKGILRDAVREYLSEHPAVESFTRGNPDEGGDAVTVVKMK